MDHLFRVLHQHLIDAIQAGRSQDAYDYARLIAFVATRASARQFTFTQRLLDATA